MCRGIHAVLCSSVLALNGPQLQEVFPRITQVTPNTTSSLWQSTRLHQEPFSSPDVAHSRQAPVVSRRPELAALPGTPHFVVLAPMPLGMQPQDDRALLCSLPLLAPSHSPFCSYPGWPAGGLNHRWQMFADRGNVLSPKTLGRCLCTHSQGVKQGTGPRKEPPEVLHLWGSLGTAHHRHDQRLKKARDRSDT